MICLLKSDSANDLMPALPQPALRRKKPMTDADTLTPTDAEIVGMEPVARIEGIDEYGPRLEWTQHWVDVGVGAKLFTESQVQAMLTAAPRNAPLYDPDDGDCARMEAALGIHVAWHSDGVVCGLRWAGATELFDDHGGDKQAARRMASLRVAAEHGKTTP